MRLTTYVVICLTVLGLLAASCAPAATQPKVPATQPPSAPAAKSEAKPAATPKPAAPVATPKPAAPAATPKPAADQPRSGGILPVHINGPTPNFDIHQESTVYVLQPLASTYSSLTKYDPLDPTKIVGDLAQRWEVSQDGKVYTFHLQKGVKWHDGQQLTAEDVKFSLDRIRKPPTGTASPRRVALSAIGDIEVIDKDTVKVVLNNPQAAFIDMLSTAWEVIMPKHVIESKGSMKRDVVGTGPFKFLKHEPGIVLEVKKNEDYFVKGRPYLDGIRFFVLSDATTRFAALRTKRILLTAFGNGVTPSQAELVERDKLPIKITPIQGATLWRFVMRLDAAPWSDIRVRRAVSLTLDRQEAVRIVSERRGDVGSSVPPNSPMAIPPAELAKLPGYRQPKDADVAEARKLLAEAGFPNGFDTTVMFRSGAIWEQPAVFFKDQLAKAGIKANLEAMESGGFIGRLFEGRFVTAFLSLGVQVFEPGVILGDYYLTGAGQNYGKYSDKEFDAMFEEQMRTMDVAKRREILLKMQYKVLETIPFVVSHWQNHLGAMWPEVRNVRPGLTVYNNHQHENTWIAQ
ncbi:MAG: ABC transporter substrate-binding protein [Chloroflexi bacterium]|nr:ABC transporter substrate-binding protein [Chloroflexota bacterium]